MAGLTAVQKWTWWWFPCCFWKHVPQSMLPTQPSHSPLVPSLAPVSNKHTAVPLRRCVAQLVRLLAEEEERPLTSLSCAAWDCEFKLNFGPFLGGGLENEKLFSFYLCNKMSSLEEENENAIWMIYYSFYLWVKKCSYILKMKKHFY